MSKRGENIRKRSDGRWEARYEKGRREDGRIQYGYLYAPTYEEVKKKKLFAQQQSYLFQAASSVSVERLCREWENSVRYTIKESSFACYDTLLNKHILPWFSGYGLCQISTELILNFTTEKTQAGLSPRTVKSLLILLQNILRYGEQMGYLSMRGIQIRYPKVVDYSLNTLPENHVQTLTAALLGMDTAFSTGILLCIYTGIRVGELCGLQWADFNFEQRLMSIRRTVSRIKNLEYNGNSTEKQSKTRVQISTPKSVSSFRDIPIPDFLLERLRSQQTSPRDYILTGTAHCTEPRQVQKRFQVLLRQCGIPPVNIHALRHAFATRCTEIGFDSKTLSEILGHSSPKITMDIYVHSSLNQKRNFMNQLFY